MKQVGLTDEQKQVLRTKDFFATWLCGCETCGHALEEECSEDCRCCATTGVCPCQVKSDNPVSDEPSEEKEQE